MKKKALFTDITLFGSTLGGTVWGDISKIVIDKITRNLMPGLTPKQRKILMDQHFHQADPNGYTPGRNYTLINRLLSMSGLFPSMILIESGFQVEFFLYDLEEMTGIKSFEELKTEIDGMNEWWKKNYKAFGRELVHLEIQERPSVAIFAEEGAKQYYLIFELF